MTEYLVVYEHDEHGWGAYSPDLEGCVVVGESRDEVERLIAEAIPFHLAGMREAGLEIPKPGHSYGFVAA